MRHQGTAVFLLLCTALAVACAYGKAQGQDATALEAQYKTCAKHYIPADKCTPEIYRQLRESDEAPPDPKTAAAFDAVKKYRATLKNPASMQVHTAYVTDKGDICLEIGGQNSWGGQTVSQVVYTSKGKWVTDRDPNMSMWPGRCTKPFGRKLVAGTDVTEKVNQLPKAEGQ